MRPSRSSWFVLLYMGNQNDSCLPGMLFSPFRHSDKQSTFRQTGYWTCIPAGAATAFQPREALGRLPDPGFVLLKRSCTEFDRNRMRSMRKIVKQSYFNAQRHKRAGLSTATCVMFSVLGYFRSLWVPLERLCERMRHLVSAAISANVSSETDKRSPTSSALFQSTSHLV